VVALAEKNVHIPVIYLNPLAFFHGAWVRGLKEPLLGGGGRDLFLLRNSWEGIYLAFGAARPISVVCVLSIYRTHLSIWFPLYILVFLRLFFTLTASTAWGLSYFSYLADNGSVYEDAIPFFYSSLFLSSLLPSSLHLTYTDHLRTYPFHLLFSTLFFSPFCRFENPFCYYHFV